MICNNNYLAAILRVCEIKDLIWVMRFQSPLVYLKCAKNFFWQNSLFHSSKEVFLQTFRQFLENWIFDEKSTAADLTKMVKILYYLKMC